MTLFLCFRRKISRCILWCFFFLNLTIAFAQDTLTVMSYNLLHFSARTERNLQRADTLGVIIQVSQPDILFVCELTDDADTLLRRALNRPGNKNYKASPFIRNTSSSEKSQGLLFYNTEKIGLKECSVIRTDLRDINCYLVYFKKKISKKSKDTVFMELYGAHLKAGPEKKSILSRYEQVKILKNNLSNFKSKNILFCGDLNFYSSTEPGYRELLRSTREKFNDPLQMPGLWHQQSAYTSVHTQSTRTERFGGGAMGGLDDRFDFILVSDALLKGSSGVSYLHGSYKVFGNDGKHFRESINTPKGKKSMFSDTVLNALHFMSDHLPVMLQVVVKP